MANQSPSPYKVPLTNITDLDFDSLAHCANYLSIQDVSNMAMSSRFLKDVAYSDSIWLSFCRKSWPLETLPVSSKIPRVRPVREAYLARRTALLQFKFVASSIEDYHLGPRYCNHILLDKNDMIFTQGSLIQTMNIDSFLSGGGSVIGLNNHNARITCMRLFPLNETSLFRSETQREENFLVTSSCDHSIRLWWKGASLRCFRGHRGVVTTMSDKLLGDGIDKVLASGGEDGTVCLWSLGSSGKRGQQALRGTLRGHVKPITLMSVAGHKSSLLVTISEDSKVRVWDTTASSAVRSSCCLGMTSVPGTPVSMKCHEDLLYVAAGSSVVRIDLRENTKVNLVPKNLQKLHSFAVMPSKSLFCTGGDGKAMLWDVRQDAHPVADLDDHAGSVTLLHMDQYKIVTGGPNNICVKVWEADTGRPTNSLKCCPDEDARKVLGCSAMAVDGYRIVTATNGDEGILRFRDFSNATLPSQFGNKKKRLYNTCNQVFASCGTGILPLHGSIEQLRRVLDEITLGDFRLSPYMSYFHELATQGTLPIKYLHLHDCDKFSVGIFCFPQSAVIPLHNHPGMTVFSKLLFGTMHIKSYDWVGDTLSIMNVSQGQQPEVRLAKVKVDSDFTAPCQTLIPFPADGGNMHCFTAVTACALLHVLAPPYKHEGPHCSYYLEFPCSMASVDGLSVPEEEKDGYAWLQEREEAPRIIHL